MARALQFIANTTGPQDNIPLDSIPQEVKDEVEQVYGNLKAHPGGRIRATFDNRAELLQYVAQATSYCNQRPSGAIRFRRSPGEGQRPQIGHPSREAPRPRFESRARGWHQKGKRDIMIHLLTSLLVSLTLMMPSAPGPNRHLIEKH